MPLDIQRIARNCEQWPAAAQREDGKLALIDAHGQFRDAVSVQVLDKLKLPPGRWTRFKAALINIPVIGRLTTIRRAGEEARIAHCCLTLIRDAMRFREDYHHQLETEFGSEIAIAAIAAATHSGANSQRGLAERVLTRFQLAGTN
jgi:hypothetical protein